MIGPESTAAGLQPVLAGDSRRGVRARVAAVVFSHPVLDAYAGFVPPLLGVLQVRCDLTDAQRAILLSISPLVSGLSQPLFAWLSDRIDSRLPGAAGLAIAAVCLSSIGLAETFTQLILIFALGMAGVGAFHPIAAASIGQLSGKRRSAGVTMFFVAGMVGATLGPLISTRITALPDGFDLLRWVMVPGLLCAIMLHFAIRNTSHRHHEHRTIRFEIAESRRRWQTVFLLFIGNAMRYSVNIALLYLYVPWAEALVGSQEPGLERGEVVERGAIYAGELNATMMLGMGIGGLFAGITIRAGRERGPMTWIPLLLAPAIALFPICGRFASYPLALLGGIGFASLIPVSITVAQRLLPHRTSLASSLSMGAAWAIAMFAPPAAEWALNIGGPVLAFELVAALLVLSGLIGLFLPSDLLRAVARNDDLST